MDTSLISDKLSDIFSGPLLEVDENTNVSKSERILSIGSGSFIFLKGISNVFSNPMLALGEVAVGAFLVHRGISGHCSIKPIIDRGADVLETETVIMTTYP